MSDVTISNDAYDAVIFDLDGVITKTAAVHEIAAVYEKYPHIGAVLPAVGYHPSQLKSLRDTINAVAADVVVAATPCDLSALIDINPPVVRARYEFAEAGEPRLSDEVTAFLKRRGLAKSSGSKNNAPGE